MGLFMKGNQSIEVINANENNLKNISVQIPQDIVCGICGVSGSGKSTLAKEVIARTGNMNFSDGLPTFLKRKIFDGRHPDVFAVNNLPPVYMVDIKNANKNSRSTVATISGLMSVIRDLYCLNYSAALEPRLFSYNINEENGGGSCSECQGTGRSDIINAENIIGNKTKSILDGGFKCINTKGIKNTKITEKFIEAFCKAQKIRIDVPVAKLNSQEMTLLLYGSKEVINFTDRSGSNNGKKSLPFPGIIGALRDVYKKTQNTSIAQYITKGTCPSCAGTRYNANARRYLYRGKSISDFLDMSITESFDFIKMEDNKDLEGLKEEYLSIATELIGIGVGYLNLSRPISSVSGGELQRIKLAKCLAGEVYNGCFILDEPSAGLHFADIDNLIKSIRKLKSRGNTVIIVEHNLNILQSCDYIIEMGQNGGEAGGNVVFAGNIKDMTSQTTRTSALFFEDCVKKKESRKTIDKTMKLKEITVNNIKGESIEIPLKAFTTIVGVSGSGKSSAINVALYNALKEYVAGKKNTSLTLDEKINEVISLSQEQGVVNSRSIVATYLNIMESIRGLYAALDDSKRFGFDKAFYSLVSGKGLCSECGGSGVIKDEDGESEEVCPVCLGRRFIAKVLEVRFKGFNISELLHLEITKLCELLKDYIDTTTLDQCKEIGVGYLTLDRPMPSLSKGEFQRVRIAKEIANAEATKKVLILDEPSKGLHISDAYKIVSSINHLVKKGNTVIAIEHNLKVVERSDYVIEFGPGAGTLGGKVMFSGVPDDLKEAKTITGEYYRKKVNANHIDSSEKLIDIISFEYDNISIRLLQDKINVICGGIGAGKSTLADNGLFAYPFKKYISMINTQGKYLTRDIEAIMVGSDNLPIARLISPTKKFFAKDERITESLNFDYYISKMFYRFGMIRCQSCGKYSKRVGNYTECTECGDNRGVVIHQTAFAYGKHTCKCPTCKGRGRFTAYDFDTIMDNSLYSDALFALLYDRTRIDRIAPLLKEKYGIDLKKNYHEMTKEEKRIFLYGDQKKEVIYKPKNKIYIWSGCNELIDTNLQYSKSQAFREYCKTTYINRTCPQCHGIGFADYVLDVRYRDISFGEFISSSIHQAYELLSKYNSTCKEESKLKEVLQTVDALGLGEVMLKSYTTDLSLGDKSIIQYLKYRYSPIKNTAILWDDFSIGKDNTTINKIVSLLQNDIKNDIYIVLFDKECFVPHANVINLNTRFSIKDNHSGQYHNIFVDKSLEEIIDKTEMTLYSKTTIGSITGVAIEIRNIFKGKNNKYSYSLPENKCTYCDGTGAYEINYGVIGIQKRLCTYCNGTGYDKSLMETQVAGFSFPDLVNRSIDDVFDWLTLNKYKISAEKLEIFKKIGLGYLKLNQGVNDMSFNESSIVLLIKIIRENKGRAISVKNFFVGLEKDVKKQLLSIVDQECISNDCKLYLSNR